MGRTLQGRPMGLKRAYRGTFQALRAGPSARHPHGDRAGRPRRIGPALLGQGDGAQADPRRTGYVTEAVAGPEATAVVAAGDENRPPEPRLVLVVLDRNQLAAPWQRRPAGANAAPEPHRLTGAETVRRDAQGRGAAHTKGKRGTAGGVQ